MYFINCAVPALEFYSKKSIVYLIKIITQTPVVLHATNKLGVYVGAVFFCFFFFFFCFFFSP